ncbi:MAG: hypothetical protein KF745_04195 [Phycisphaeraceae bacterium]|nr:hypothetical protein [Phycisphaeraceae bacterium]
MRHFLSALSLSLALTLSPSPGLATAGDSGQPRMVQPESLEQGFILVVTDKPNIATSDAPIYIASSHNGWNPGDPAQRLTPRSDRRWQIVFPKPVLDSRIAFKFTRGSWESVETAAEFKDIENRTLPLIDASTLKPGEPPIIELTVEAWRDQQSPDASALAANPYREIKIAPGGSLRRLAVVSGGASASLARDALIWLPPGYNAPENASRRYPVLYLQDGQNLFEKLPAVPGEWEVDETAARLIAQKKIEPLIIVGIPHAGTARAVEYTPAPVIDGVEARADAYLEFLTREVLPRVNRAFRTQTGPEHTGIGGSSLGGTFAVYAALKRPDLFGKVLAESPAVLDRKGGMVMQLFRDSSQWPSRLYIGMGGKEAGDNVAPSANDGYVKTARDLDQLAKSKGVPDTGRRLIVDPDATHTESAWAKRLPAALEFLFPANP